MLRPARPYVLTIGGFDPTGGAGVLADIKTTERLRCYGMSVLTANTVQRENKVLSVDWLTFDYLRAQINSIAHCRFKTIKIGIVEHPAMLELILEGVKRSWPKAQVIWDPVISGSDNTVFFDYEAHSDISHIISRVDIITPNSKELSLLSNKKSINEQLSHLSKYTKVYLTGGHPGSSQEDQLGVDYFADENGIIKLNPKPGTYSEKHGSGCIFSTALACHLALEYPLHQALLKSKRYIERALKSNKSLLAYHYQ